MDAKFISGSTDSLLYMKTDEKSKVII